MTRSLVRSCVLIALISAGLCSCLPDLDGKPDTGAIPEGDADADADADTDSDADSDTDADTDTGSTQDQDGDGFSVDEGDCDDENPEVNPGQNETCLDGLDNDCDGTTDICSLSTIENVIVGESEYEYVGQHTAIVGDVNADGNADVAIGNDRSEAAGSGGATFIFYGPVQGERTLSSADAVLSGHVNTDRVAAAGDINQDGYDDILVGDYFAGDGVASGTAFLVMGPPEASVDLWSEAIAFYGEAEQDYAAVALTGVGDLDSNESQDIAIGAYWHDAGGEHAGTAYLVSGPITASMSLSQATAKLYGTSVDEWAGAGLAGAGDIDGDGCDDLIVGAPGASSQGSFTGAAYVVTGPVSGTASLESVGVRIDGEASGDSTGYCVSGASDINGDGYDDILIPAKGSDRGGENAGAVFLLLGPVSEEASLSSAEGILLGATENASAGYSLSQAGDIDADGIPDIIIGAYSDSTAAEWAGAAYVVHGPVSGTASLATVGAAMLGPEGGSATGISVSGAGDIDGDGGLDVFIGAQSVDGAGTDSGAAYIIYSAFP